MKTKVLLLILLFFSFSARIWSQAIDEKDVPDGVKKALTEKFTVTGTPDWEKQNEDYSANFYSGNYKGIISIKADGTYIKSEMEVNPQTVPDPVKNYINEHFKGLKIEYARFYEYENKKDNYYYVTAPKMIKSKKYIPEFSVTPKGKLISENIPPELESSRTMAEASPASQPTKKEETTGKKQAGHSLQTGAKKGEKGTTPAQTKAQGKTNTKNAKKGAADETGATPENSNIPQAAKDGFNKKYKQAAQVVWKATETGCVASYEIKGVKNFAFYSKEGKFEKNQTIIDKKNIPPPVQKTINTNYSGQKVDSIYNVTTAENQKFFEIKLSEKKGKTEVYTRIFTSPSGQLIKEVLPEGSEKEAEGQEQTLNNTAIPKSVLGSFNIKFAKASEIKWTKSDSNYTANFFFKGEKMTSEYTSDGKWQQTIKNVAFAKLPPPVQNFFNTKYKKEKMETSQYIETNKKEKYYYIVTSILIGKGNDKSKKITMTKISPAAKVIEQTSE